MILGIAILAVLIVLYAAVAVKLGARRLPCR